MKALPDYRLVLVVLAILLLAGCTTPRTMLRNPTTGQVVTCGGNTGSSVAGGMGGYSLQKSSDERCVASHRAQGFVPLP